MEHLLTITRWTLGRSPIKGFPPMYGTFARCSCRTWNWSTNAVPPSRGGTSQATYAHEQHVATITAAEEVADLLARYEVARAERMVREAAERIEGVGLTVANATALRDVLGRYLDAYERLDFIRSSSGK